MCSPACASAGPGDPPGEQRRNRSGLLCSSGGEQSTDLGAQNVLLAAAQVVGHQSAQTTIKHYAAATAGERALLERVTAEALE